MTLRIGSDELVERLARARAPGPVGMAFDADGTLWSGDVGEDVFEFAYEQGLFREAARGELARVATEHGLDGHATSSELARALYGAYRLGKIDDRLVCEVMTWGYAGHSEDEVRGLAREAFRKRALSSRMRDILNPVFDWARRESVRVVVVSASPRVIVKEALAAVGLGVHDVAGAVPEMDGDRIAPKMAAPVPFGADKCVAGRSLLAEHQWLASFGDNFFDVDLLRAAKIGVAVCPKPTLSARLGEIDGVLVLE